MVFNKRFNIFLIIIAMLTLIITGCGSSTSDRAVGSKSTKQTQTNAQEQNQTVERGDGTLTISLNVLNPDQKQTGYKIAFTRPEAIIRGEAVSSQFIKSYDIESDKPTTIQIEDLSSILYLGGLDEPLQLDLTVVRVEDTNLRNPLAEPVLLTFVDKTTCEQGKEITLDMTDAPLTALYPEGTFLVKIQQVPESKDQGGYVDFKYKPQDGGMPLTLGKGSSGPDFLVTFNASDFKERGIRDTILSIVDSSNKAISESAELKFDENGYCEQGQFIIMERTK